MRTRLYVLLLAAIFGFSLFALALDSAQEDPLEHVEPRPLQRDPAGRRLYLLIIDSLATADIDDLPSLQAVAAGSFAATVQPCTDNFTVSCVREALTGRSRQSLFSVLENFKVVSTATGASLISDARAASLRTALVSAGNLKTWRKEADADIRVDEGDTRPEVEIGLEAAGTYDIVIHHWIWLDVASHHMRSRPKQYAQALADTNALVAGLAARVPADMDLIITGDHGHAKDGRHIEGLDTPTYVVVRSPNVRPVHPEGRIPITALRFLAGAATGLGSSTATIDPTWRSWLDDRVGESVRTAGIELTQAPPAELPWTILATAALVALAGITALNWRVGLIAVAWACALGAALQPWLHFVGQRGRFSDFTDWSWTIPVVAGVAVGWWRRNPAAVCWGATVGGIVLLFGLWPGLSRFSVFQNEMSIVPPLVAAWALLAVLAARVKGQDRRTRLRMLVAAGLLVLVACVFPLVADFNANQYWIRRYPLGWAKASAWWTPPLVAALGAAYTALLDRRPAIVLLGAAVAVAGRHLPAPAEAAVFAALALALAVHRGPQPALVIGLIALASTGFALEGRRLVGALATIVLLGLALRVLAWLGIRGEPRIEREVTWGAALLLLIGAHLGLAWTSGLTISGINFDFALSWLEGRWHVRLWWVVAAAMVLKMVLPLVMLAMVARAALAGEALRRALDVAARLAVLRFAATICVVVVWLESANASLSSSQTRTLLYEGVLWLVIALALGGLSLRRAAVAEPAPIAGPAVV